MADNADLLIGSYIEIIPDSEKPYFRFTIPRESFRQNRGLGIHTDKAYDLLTYTTGSPGIDRQLREANEATAVAVYKALRAIKDAGFQAGLALEPGTSLDNVTEDMVAQFDMLHLMTAHSGTDDYDPSVLLKIRRARALWPGLTIQAEGGLTSQSIEEVLKAGANAIVTHEDLDALDELREMDH
jgi:hypothetical protein